MNIQVGGCFCHWLGEDGDQPTDEPCPSLLISWASCANYPGMTAENLPPIQALVLVMVGLPGGISLMLSWSLDCVNAMLVTDAGSS